MLDCLFSRSQSAQKNPLKALYSVTASACYLHSSTQSNNNKMSTWTTWVYAYNQIREAYSNDGWPKNEATCPWEDTIQFACQ